MNSETLLDVVLYTYRAKLERVVDGDTIDAIIDLGFDIWVKKRIRLHGIDAPETRTRDLEEKNRGKVTKARLIKILDDANNEFLIISHGVGKYGRCLGELFVNNQSVNQQLIAEGMAVKYNS
jgi:micrococcal nuclease